MKRLFLACLILTPGLLAISPAPTSTPEIFSDKVCPNATGPVREFNAQMANSNTLVDDAIAGARRVIEAYKLCGDGMQLVSSSAGNTASVPSPTQGVEGLHLTQIRRAQYCVIVGRLQRLTENFNSARDSYQTALDLVKETIDWKSPSQTVYYSNNVHVGSGSSRNPTTDFSVYRQSAIDIRDDALAEMKLLPAGAAGAPNPK